MRNFFNCSDQIEWHEETRGDHPSSVVFSCNSESLYVQMMENLRRLMDQFGLELEGGEPAAHEPGVLRFINRGRFRNSISDSGRTLSFQDWQSEELAKKRDYGVRICYNDYFSRRNVQELLFYKFLAAPLNLEALKAIQGLCRKFGLKVKEILDAHGETMMVVLEPKKSNSLRMGELNMAVAKMVADQALTVDFVNGDNRTQSF